MIRFVSYKVNLWFSLLLSSFSVLSLRLWHNLSIKKRMKRNSYKIDIRNQSRFDVAMNLLKIKTKIEVFLRFANTASESFKTSIIILMPSPVKASVTC